MRTTIFLLCSILVCFCTGKPFKKVEQKEELTQLKVAAYNGEYSKNATAAETGSNTPPATVPNQRRIRPSWPIRTINTIK